MYYYQYSKWYGPHLVELVFENKCVTGKGVDDVESFTVTGHYLEETAQVTLTKKYQRGTGDQRENFGHEVKIQLKWSDNQQRFSGK
jgi:hypothetical protein